MKAFLMYRDRDFDPRQILQQRERRPYRRDEAPALEQLLPWNQQALRQDLGLDILFRSMALGDNFLFETAMVAVLSSVANPDTIRYRQQILKDSLDHEAIVRDMYRIAVEAIEGEKKNYWSFYGRYPSGTLNRAIGVLTLFVNALRKLRRMADDYADVFHSDGFSKLFAMLKAELTDAYFVVIENHLRELRFRGGVLISAQLGRGNEGTSYVLRKPKRDPRNWIARTLARRPPGFTYRLHPRDEAGARALADLQDQGLNVVANALAQSCDHILNFFQMLRTELAFYIGCANLRRQLHDIGALVCFPAPAPHGDRKLTFSGLYDAALALSIQGKVVANGLDADGKDLIVITGANSGGKSTFLRSLGLGQVMMQAGMFVPAVHFLAEVRDAVFTHYKREEDTKMESGKLDEELSRMSEIVGRLTPRSMLLFNESFAATNEREGSEIAGQIVNALVERGVKVCFVTHLYEFAHYEYERNLENATFLRAERRADGTRTFRLMPAEPLQTSFGRDLYAAVFPDEPVPPAEAKRLPLAG